MIRKLATLSPLVPCISSSPSSSSNAAPSTASSLPLLLFLLLGLGGGITTAVSPSLALSPKPPIPSEDDYKDSSSLPPSPSHLRQLQHDRACALLLQHLFRFSLPPSLSSSSSSPSSRRFHRDARGNNAPIIRQYLQRTLPLSLPSSHQKTGGEGEGDRSGVHTNECRDSLGRSALAVAAMQGDVASVEVLMDGGYWVGGEDVHRLTPLSYAAWKGHVKVVRALLQGGAEGGHMDDFGVSPLHKAVSFGHPEVVVALLEGGTDGGSVDVNLKTGSVLAPPHYEAKTLHQTPLHLALRPSLTLSPELRLQIVETLLGFGASVCIEDVNDDTAVHAAARLGDARVLWSVLVHAIAEEKRREREGVREGGREGDKVWKRRNKKEETPLQCLPWASWCLVPLFVMAGAWGG